MMAMSSVKVISGSPGSLQQLTPDAGWLAAKQILLEETLSPGEHFTRQYESPSGMAGIDPVCLMGLFYCERSKRCPNTSGLNCL